MGAIKAKKTTEVMVLKNKLEVHKRKLRARKEEHHKLVKKLRIAKLHKTVLKMPKTSLMMSEKKIKTSTKIMETEKKTVEIKIETIVEIKKVIEIQIIEIRKYTEQVPVSAEARVEIAK